MEQAKQILLNKNQNKKSLSNLLDIRLISTSIIAVIAYIFYQFGYSFLYGFYFVDEPINVIRIISNPIPFDIKAVVAIGIISFICLVTFLYANFYIREQRTKIIVKIIEYLLPSAYALCVLAIITLVAKPKNSISLLVQLLSYSYALNSIYISVYSIKYKRSPLIISSIFWTIILIILSADFFSIPMTSVSLLFIWSISVAIEDILYIITASLDKKDKSDANDKMDNTNETSKVGKTKSEFGLVRNNTHGNSNNSGDNDDLIQNKDKRKRNILAWVMHNVFSIFKLPPIDKFKGVCLFLANYLKNFPLYFCVQVIIHDICKRFSKQFPIQDHIYIYIIIFTLVLHIIWRLIYYACCCVWNFIYSVIKKKIRKNNRSVFYTKFSILHSVKLFEGLAWFILPIYSIISLIAIYYFMGQLGNFVGKNSLNDNINVITYSTISGCEKSVYGNIIAQDSQFYYVIGIPDQKLYLLKATHINSIPTNNQVLTQKFTIVKGSNGTSTSSTKIEERNILLINDNIYITISDFFEIFSMHLKYDFNNPNVNYTFNEIQYNINVKNGVIMKDNIFQEITHKPILLNDVVIIPLEDILKVMNVSVNKENNNICISY